jgi:hypothetical protein
MRNSPIITGICNAVIPGLGYVVLGERKIFGWLMLAGSLICIFLSFVEPAFMSRTFFVSETIFGKVLEAAWYLCFLAAFAYDAWSMATKKREASLMPMIVNQPS